MNQNLLGSIYGMLCIKFPPSRMKDERHRLSPLSLWLITDVSLFHINFMGILFIRESCGAASTLSEEYAIILQHYCRFHRKPCLVTFCSDEGAAVVVVLCFQSVPINTKIVSSNLNPVHGEYLDSHIM